MTVNAAGSQSEGENMMIRHKAKTNSANATANTLMIDQAVSSISFALARRVAGLVGVAGVGRVCMVHVPFGYKQKCLTYMEPMRNMAA
ncbi:hypothetical protein CAP31_02605 [Sulfuriferula sp. AH1]|nr:hypothetical protein CAP31_02605 [Sulfuriferula sp. AH1]